MLPGLGSDLFQLFSHSITSPLSHSGSLANKLTIDQKMFEVRFCWMKITKY
jgi:hypothetical protein